MTTSVPEKIKVGAAEVRVAVRGSSLLPTAGSAACCCCCCSSCSVNRK